MDQAGMDVKAVRRIKEALDLIATDVTRPENASVWSQFHAIEPERSRIELFDMVWWMYFRQVEPVVRVRLCRRPLPAGYPTPPDPDDECVE
jgi:hypothetical protein